MKCVYPIQGKLYIVEDPFAFSPIAIPKTVLSRKGIEWHTIMMFVKWEIEHTTTGATGKNILFLNAQFLGPDETYYCTHAAEIYIGDYGNQPDDAMKQYFDVNHKVWRDCKYLRAGIVSEI